MKKVFLIHGFDGSPNGGWRPWLMGELEKQDVYACALPMSDPGNPIPNEWNEEISRQVTRNRNDDIYLVGHSLGVPAILRYVETSSAGNVKGIVLVSGPIQKTDNDKVNAFLEKPFDFSLIKSKAGKCVVIQGDNDPKVPFSDAEMLAKELNGKLVVIKNGGHLNGSSGWLKLPECLDALNEMMKI
jgi:predicted alpha/beta hydrolase family esterase